MTLNLARSLGVLQALSDAQSFLFEERQRLLALQAENDELKLQELEDRKRIQHLLSMTTPLEQEVGREAAAQAETTVVWRLCGLVVCMQVNALARPFPPRARQQRVLAIITLPPTPATAAAQVGYVQQGLPSAVTHYPSSSAPSGQPQQQGQQPQQHGGRQAASGERVLRTVFLPTANADALLLKIESLQAQLQEQVCGGSGGEEGVRETRIRWMAAGALPIHGAWVCECAAGASFACLCLACPFMPPHFFHACSCPHTACMPALAHTQKQLGEERVASLLADRKLREQEEARHRAAFNAQVCQATAAASSAAQRAGAMAASTRP